MDLKSILYCFKPRCRYFSPLGPASMLPVGLGMGYSFWMSSIANRLEKNWLKIATQAKKLGIDAFRFYDRDIPEFPYVAEMYGEVALIQDRRQEIDFTESRKSHHEEFLKAIEAVAKPHEVILKTRRPQRQQGDKSDQYQKISRRGERFKVREGALQFWINPYDYQDCGLFLDHRRLRDRVAQILKPGQSFLNLFAYTGSFSVYGARRGAKVTSVDLSTTYTLWAEDNFKLNGLSLEGHEFIGGDVRQFLNQAKAKWDLILLDPPTFSNSKRTEEDFDVQRDHVELISLCLKRLKEDGLLLFSCNKRDFKLDSVVTKGLSVKDISQETLPFDFRDPKIRKVFEIRASPAML